MTDALHLLGVDVNTRTRVRQARDAEVRRALGLPARGHTSTPMLTGDRTRRWNDAEIRAAVLRLTRGRKVPRSTYKALRAKHGPEFPHPETVALRCPELFT